MGGANFTTQSPPQSEPLKSTPRARLRHVPLQICLSLQLNKGYKKLVHADYSKYTFNMKAIFKTYFSYTIFIKVDVAW